MPEKSKDVSSVDNSLREKKSTEEADLIGESISRGNSLTSVKEKLSLGKYQNIVITEKPQKKRSMGNDDNLTAEQKTLKHFEETGEVVWHTYQKAEPLEEMDLDFKIVAAFHSLKNANRINDQLSRHDEKWREKLTNKLTLFMHVFQAIEEHLENEHGISLPEKVEDIRGLREELKNSSNGEEEVSSD